MQSESQPLQQKAYRRVLESLQKPCFFANHSHRAVISKTPWESEDVLWVNCSCIECRTHVLALSGYAMTGICIVLPTAPFRACTALILEKTSPVRDEMLHSLALSALFKELICRIPRSCERAQKKYFRYRGKSKCTNMCRSLAILNVKLHQRNFLSRFLLLFGQILWGLVSILYICCKCVVSWTLQGCPSAILCPRDVVFVRFVAPMLALKEHLGTLWDPKTTERCVNTSEN